MNDFLRETQLRHLFFRKSLQFYSDNYFYRFLKVLTFLLLIIPTLTFSLLTFVMSALNIFLGYLPLIGWVSSAICGILTFLVEIMYKMCNLPELKQYSEIVDYIAEEFRRSSV